jgi:hypothetical protein
VYVWSNANCCLPQNALSLALAGSYPDLQLGDYLLLDDGQGQRDIVQLTKPPAIVPANPATSSPDGSVTLVSWSTATPLHHTYCVRALGDLTRPRLVVRGNVAPATHGETTIPGESLREQGLRLRHAPLAYLRPDTPGLPGPQNPAGPLPLRQPRGISTLTLRVEGFAQPWQEVPTLLDSRPDDQHFRVEIDDAGDATIVFGTGPFGLQPSATAKITASYRVGGGAAGNVGADTLVQLQTREGESFPWFASVSNPLPAVGGRDLESRDHARRFAPQTFKKPLVAVTAADYQAASQDFEDASGEQLIQRARAAFRWTGSWLTVTLAVDPRGAETLDSGLRQALLQYLDTRRLASYDLEIIRPIYVPVELEIDICLKSGFRPGDVEQGLLQTLSSTDLPGGKKGFFHPDNFTFGQYLYVSQIYAAVMTVPGVDSAHITSLSRFRTARPERETAINLAQGFLAVGPDEIVRLDNDRNFPQNGTLRIGQRGVGA